MKFSVSTTQLKAMIGRFAITLALAYLIYVWVRVMGRPLDDAAYVGAGTCGVLLLLGVYIAYRNAIEGRVLEAFFVIGAANPAILDRYVYSLDKWHPSLLVPPLQLAWLDVAVPSWRILFALCAIVVVAAVTARFFGPKQTPH